MLSPKQQEKMISFCSTIFFYTVHNQKLDSTAGTYLEEYKQGKRSKEKNHTPSQGDGKTSPRRRALHLRQGWDNTSIITEEHPMPAAVRHCSLAALHLLCPWTSGTTNREEQQ